MSEDFGLKLLAAIEALAADVRGLREDAQADRNATKTLQDQRRAKADKQARWRSKEKRVASTETLQRSVSVDPTPPVLDLEAKKLDLKTPTLRHKDPTQQSSVAEVRQHFEARFLSERGEPYYWQGAKDVQGAKALLAAAGKSVDGAGKLVDAGFRIAASDGFWAKNIGLAFFGSKVNALKGQNGQVQRPGAASLHITPEAKRDHAIPGRKIL